MKTIQLLSALLLLTFSPAIAQIPSISEYKTEPTAVTTGISFKFHSKSMDEDRTVMIGVPQGYEKSTKKYPVFYLLDAQPAFFLH